MTADPVRPQETLRERIAEAIDGAIPDDPEFDIMNVRRVLACADAVLPIVEEETKPLVEEIEEFAVELVNERAEHQALRDKVKTLAGKWAQEARDLDNSDDPWQEEPIAVGLMRHEVELLALVEEPQGGER